MRTHCPLSMSPMRTAFTLTPSRQLLESAFIRAIPAARRDRARVAAPPGALAATASVKSTTPRPAPLRQHTSGEPHHAHQLQLEVLVPGGVVETIDCAGGRTPGVVHHPVDTIPTGDGGVDERCDVGCTRHVGTLREHVGARLAQRRLGGAQTFLVPPADGDRCPSAASRLASPSPSPSVPPVMSTTLPASSRSMVTPSSRRHRGGADARQESLCLRLRAQADEAQPRPARVPAASV